MLRIIYGAKGSGKTQKLIAEANEMVEKSSGNLVFLTYTDRYKFELNYNIRLINVENFSVGNEEQLAGFVKGILASNSDIDMIYIDGAHRITGKKPEDMQLFYDEIAKAGKNSAAEIVISVSSDALPSFLSSYDAEKVQ